MRALLCDALLFVSEVFAVATGIVLGLFAFAYLVTFIVPPPQCGWLCLP